MLRNDCTLIISTRRPALCGLQCGSLEKMIRGENVKADADNLMITGENRIVVFVLVIIDLLFIYNKNNLD